MLSRSYAKRAITKRGVKTLNMDWEPIKSSVNNLAKAENQAKAPIFRKVMFGLMVAMPVISFGLGCWQVKRLQWKVDLIKRSEHMLAAEPLDGLPAVIDPSVIKDFEYRRFKVRGTFNYDQEMFLGPRLRHGELGYLVVTPFVRSDGGKPILIERGWIKKDKVVPQSRSKGYLSHLAMPQGEITIEAMLRCMPQKSHLQYDHEEGSRLFYVPDVEGMAQQSGSLPVYAQMIYSLRDQPTWTGPDECEKQPSEPKGWWLFSGSTNKTHRDHLPEATDDSTLEWQELEFMRRGVPIAAIPKVNFSNNHFQYLITWFGVSIASSVLLLLMFYKKKGLSSAEKVIAAKKKDIAQNL